MDRDSTPDDLIATALSLPPSQRVEIMDAIQASLVDSAPDHDGEEPHGDTEAAWNEEVSRRVDDVKHNRVKTIPADSAEGAIRDDGRRYRLNITPMRLQKRRRPTLGIRKRVKPPLVVFGKS